MLKLISKIKILYEKTKFYQLLEWEQNYIRTTYQTILAKDESSLRAKLAGLKAIKQPEKDTQMKISELDAEITEIVQYKNILEKGQNKKTDLERQIKFFKENFFK